MTAIDGAAYELAEPMVNDCIGSGCSSDPYAPCDVVFVFLCVFFSLFCGFFLHFFVYLGTIYIINK